MSVGDSNGLRHQDKVKAEGIQAVLRLDLIPREEPRYGQWSDDFVLKDMPFSDGEEPPTHILKAGATFIHEQVEAERPVLVHCHMGISRSCTVVLAYLIEYEGMTLGEAFLTVKEERSIVNPHPSLLRSLVELYDLPYTPTDVDDPHFLSRIMVD